MRSAVRAASVLALAGVLAGLGCSPGVRQDRTITWSAEGNAVGFQHDQEGVFIANEEGGQLEKIFQPGADALVTSSPLWSPKGGRLIFTVARDPNASPAPNQPVPFMPNPEGDIFRQRRVVYTCWLWEKPRPGQTMQPVALFDAACDHPGYVAANLAVRWHPQGDRVLYLKETADHQHGLFEFDLKTKSSRQVFPQTAEALVFDWTPDGSRLVCVVADSKASAGRDGIWIGRPDRAAWWHVPNSEAPPAEPRPSLVEHVRARRPAWTQDGDRFAFAVWQPGKPNETPDCGSLWVGDPAAETVEEWATGTEPFRDLHWTPDGSHLGVVAGNVTGSLYLMSKRGELGAAINRVPVRRFAGWDGRGDQLAYVVPSPATTPDANAWAFLLTPEAMPRDAVFVGPGNGCTPGKEVFSGMRVTFPQWSPKDNKLSVWFTFQPTYRSLPARLLGIGLPSGDPAAVLDLKGRINWMAVNAQEKAQVGHYHLLKRQYAEAWKWYQEAEAGRPPAQPAPVPEVPLQNLLTRRDFSFFEYLCLAKLGKEAEARAKLEQFRASFAPVPKPAAMSQWDHFWAGLVRDLYAAEVFVSVDAAPESIPYFQGALAAAQTDGDRLSSAVVLAQILLLQKDHTGYADLVTDTIRPLVLKLGKTDDLHILGPAVQGTQELVRLPVELTVLPIFTPEFLATLSDEQLRALIPRWTAQEATKAEDDFRLMTDLFLTAAYERVGPAKEQKAAAARVESNPARTAFLPKGLAERIKEMRELPAQLDALRELFSGR